MAYPVPTPAPAPSPPVRPGVVSAAAGLLILLAVLQVISGALSLVEIPSVTKAIDSLPADTPNLESIRLQYQASLYGGLVVSVVIAIAFAVLAIFVGKGKQPARVVTWVLGGLGALCCSCGLLSTAATGALSDMIAESDPATAEITQTITDAVPGWITAASVGVSVVSLLALLLVIILLALPAANDYFRPAPVAQWVPPTGPGYQPLG